MPSPQNISASPRVQSSLSLPARLEYIKPVQNYVEGLCEVHGCEKKESLMVVLAVEEAVSNVIRHGYASEKGGTFDISFDVGAADLIIGIHDKGLPFDQPRLNTCRKRDELSPPDSHEGLGVRLMKGTMDRVEFINLGKQGKLVRMFKYFRHSKIDPDLTDDQCQKNAAPDETAIVPPFAVRPLMEKEAFEVSRCAYRAYGYTYREFIYYPQKIWELNQDGQLHSFVLVDGQNKLLGHLALSFSVPESTIAELAAAFVDPACRGKRLLQKLMVTVMSKAEAMGLQNLFVHAVTSHHASQKGATRAGFIPTGLLLAALFPDLEFKALSGRVNQKESALLMVKPLKTRLPYTLYVPARYTDIIRSLSTDIGQTVSIKTLSSPLPDVSGGEGNRYYQVEEFNFAEIRIRTFGEDVLEELGQRVKTYVKNQVDVIYLYLDIECPEAVSFVSRCLELGFFFCGYMPGEMAGRDGLILQKLNDISIDFKTLDLDGDPAHEVMEFIQNEMADCEEEQE